MKSMQHYAIRLLLLLFLGYTTYLIVWLFVLNKTSMTAGYIQHSKTVSEAKDKGSFAGEYLLSQADQIHSPYLPSSLFLEEERILYPHFYFYFGKTKKGNLFTVDAGSFDKLIKIEEFIVSSPMSTLPNEKTNITAKPLYFFYDSAYHELRFLLYHQNQAVDTITYKKQQ